MTTIDTTNMCSHLQRKLFEEDGEYHRLWMAMQDDPELTAVVRSRQLHNYRNGKKVLVLAGKSSPKIIREDRICEIKKHRLASYAVLACGIILMLWIVLEWWIWGFNALSNIYFVLGLAEVVAAVFCLRKQEKTL